MRAIVIKIKLHVPASGTLLHDLSRAIERYLKKQGVQFERIDAAVKLDEDE
jgi:hypothetical protein